MNESTSLYTKAQPEHIQAEASCSTKQACGYAPDPYQLILDRLAYHHKSIRELDALFNALPRTLPREAADALLQLLLDAKPRY